jgi:Flp pilus assembly pilin Flp
MLDDLGLRLGMAPAAARGLPMQLRREEGQALVEYTLMLATIAIGLFVAMGALRDQLANAFNQIGSAI